MKKININYRPGWREYSVIALGTVLLTCGLAYNGLKRVNTWYDGHQLVFNRPVSVIFKKPIEVKERQIEIKQIVEVINEIPNPVDLHTDAEKYIYEKFGIEDYKVAIAVAKAESGMKEGRIGINTNNTIDVGEFQINSIHFNRPGCSLKEVATTRGNIDCAYQIFKEQGWNPWVAFKNGNFIAKLDK